ncbi:MAG: radical SAM protein [Desulfobacterales bacterium]|nr:radical SAM protein [Desulfobacterales bacterium]
MKNRIYPLRVVRNIVKARWYRFTGRRRFVLRGIDFAVTYACNFKCEHCYAAKLMDRDRQLMTIGDYRRVCQQAMELGCLCFSLQGGEVFLRKDWREVIGAFQPEYNHILLTTNGSLITEDRVKELKRLGLDTLYFSVDSGIAQEHDAFRKHPGSFQKILTAVEHCKKHKIKVVFNTCVTKQNLYSPGFKKLLDYTHENRILVETIFARCLGNFDGRHEVMLNEADAAYYYQLRKKYPFVVRDLDNNYGQWGCPTVKEVLYITAYGDVCPCPYSHISLGNIQHEPLKVIRERGLKSRWYDHYHAECLTAMDDDFMKLYYPPVEQKSLITLEELEKL